MALIVNFTPRSMTTSQYDETIRRLEEAGAGTPPGRLYHVCHGSDDQLRVTDVWESEETLQQFAQVLLPILEQLGIEVGTPDIRPVHNTIVG